MAFQEGTGFCKVCDKQVMTRRPGTNHILHLLLSVVTMGFWIIIWILVSFKIGGWRCTQCGSEVSDKKWGSAWADPSGGTKW